MARRYLPPDLDTDQLRLLGVLPEKPSREAPSEEYLLRAHGHRNEPVTEERSSLSDVAVVLDEHKRVTVGSRPAGLAFMDKIDSSDRVQERLKPMPRQTAERGRLRMHGGVKGPAYTLTEHEAARSNRYREPARRGRELTDAEREAAEAADLYVDLDVGVWKDMEEPIVVPARKVLPALRTFEAETAEMLDALFARYGF